MESLFKLSKTAFSWIPGNPVRKALYMNIFLWLLIGGGIGALAGNLVICNLGGGFALGPGLIGGLYWWMNHDD